MKKKQKIHVIIISRTFPKTHKRKGELTGFVENVGLDKLHTIRGNYKYWKKKIDEVNKGEAILSLRYWSGKPYNSSQIEVYQFTKDSGIGYERLLFEEKNINNPLIYNDLSIADFMRLNLRELATNDHLTQVDFLDWFKSYDLSKEMVIIHFTKFRYSEQKIDSKFITQKA